MHSDGDVEREAEGAAHRSKRSCDESEAEQSFYEVLRSGIGLEVYGTLCRLLDEEGVHRSGINSNYVAEILKLHKVFDSKIKRRKQLEILRATKLFNPFRSTLGKRVQSVVKLAGHQVSTDLTALEWL